MKRRAILMIVLMVFSSIIIAQIVQGDGPEEGDRVAIGSLVREYHDGSWYTVRDNRRTDTRVEDRSQDFVSEMFTEQERYLEAQSSGETYIPPSVERIPTSTEAEHERIGDTDYYRQDDGTWIQQTGGADPEPVDNDDLRARLDRTYQIDQSACRSATRGACRSRSDYLRDYEEDIARARPPSEAALPEPTDMTFTEEELSSTPLEGTTHSLGDGGRVEYRDGEWVFINAEGEIEEMTEGQQQRVMNEYRDPETRDNFEEPPVDMDFTLEEARGRTITVRRQEARDVPDGTFGELGDTSYEYRDGCWRSGQDCVDAETNTRLNGEFANPDSERRFTNAIGDTIPMEDRVTTTERDIPAPPDGTFTQGRVRDNSVVYEDGHWYIYDDEGNRVEPGGRRSQDDFDEEMNNHYGQNQDRYRQTYAYDTETGEVRVATPAECAQARATLVCCPSELECQQRERDYEAAVERSRMQNIWEGKTVIRSYIKIFQAFGMDDEWDREAFQGLHEWADTTAGLAVSGHWAESICRYTPDLDQTTGMIQYPGSGQFGMWIEGAKSVSLRRNESDPLRGGQLQKLYKITGSVMPAGMTQNSGTENCADQVRFNIMLDDTIVDLGEEGPADDLVVLGCDTAPYALTGQNAMYIIDSRNFERICFRFDSRNLKMTIDEQLQGGLLCARIVESGSPADLGCEYDAEHQGSPVDCSNLPDAAPEEMGSSPEEPQENRPTPRAPTSGEV